MIDKLAGLLVVPVIQTRDLDLLWQNKEIAGWRENNIWQHFNRRILHKSTRFLTIRGNEQQIYSLEFFSGMCADGSIIESYWCSGVEFTLAHPL